MVHPAISFIAVSVACTCIFPFVDIDAICSAIKFGDKQGWTYSAKAEKAARAKHLAEFSKYAKAHSTVTGLAKAK